MPFFYPSKANQKVNAPIQTITLSAPYPCLQVDSLESPAQSQFVFSCGCRLISQYQQTLHNHCFITKVIYLSNRYGRPCFACRLLWHMARQRWRSKMTNLSKWLSARDVCALKYPMCRWCKEKMCFVVWLGTEIRTAKTISETGYLATCVLLHIIQFQILSVLTSILILI